MLVVMPIAIGTSQGARKSCGPVAVMMAAAAVKEEEQAEDKDDAEPGQSHTHSVSSHSVGRILCARCGHDASQGT